MPGQDLCVELGCWVPDETLLNCCSSNPDEPPDGDDFDFRMRERNDLPRWLDTRKDVPSFDDVQDSSAGHSIDEENDCPTLKVRHTLTLPDIPKDYTKGMYVDIDVEKVFAGSCSRLPCSRGVRFKR
jgi:hypothetical protein